MSELRTCPSCGAQTSASVCEYCGTKIPAKKVYVEESIGKSFGFGDFAYDVIPFKATENQAVSVVRQRLSALQNQIKNEISELGRSYHGLSLNISEAKAVYVPFNALKNADKVKSLQCNGITKDLPRWFPTSLSGSIWENTTTNRPLLKQKNRELGRASIVVPIKENNPTNAGDDRFITVDDTVYLPFWVVNGQLGSSEFSAFVFAGGKEKPELINITTDDGNIKDVGKATGF